MSHLLLQLYKKNQFNRYSYKKANLRYTFWLCLTSFTFFSDIYLDLLRQYDELLTNGCTLALKIDV